MKEETNTREGMNSWLLGDAEASISDLKDRIMKISQSEQQKENKYFFFLNENSLRDFSHNQKYQYSYYRVHGSRRKREKGNENAFDEITAENFPNLNKKKDIQG